MKLRSIENEASLVNEPTASDLDAASRLGPTINKHLTSLEALCKLLPECGTILNSIHALRDEFANKIQLQGNVLESPIQIEQQVKQHSQKSVGRLENKLKDLAKGSAKLDYQTIDHAMQEISKTNGVTPDDLHKLFAASHGGMKPDDYAIAMRNHSINEEIAILFDSLSESCGNTVWVAITKHLAKQGYDKTEIKESVDQAINRLDL